MSFFVLMGMASGGFNQAGQNMVLELGESRDIPLRVAVSNTAVNFIGTIGPMTGGALALLAGYETIFVVCTVMQLIALAILLVWIPEPRTLITATSEPDTHHSRQ